VLIEPVTGTVTGRAGATHLPPKAVEVLLRLADDPGEITTREALRRAAWGDGHGSEEALGHAIHQIRHALNDHSDNPRFIQTVPRRGYRLLITPEPVTAVTSPVVLGMPNGARRSDIGFLEALNRRGVLETGIAYLVVGWLLIQVVDVVFDQLHVPDWAGTFVTVLVIAGLPIALALSWFLEFRDGRAIVDTLSTAAHRRKRFSRTYLSVVGALGGAAVLVFAYDRLVGLPGAEEPLASVEDAGAESPYLPPVRDNSFAVLPFVSVDGGEETSIFARGLVEDLIIRLTRVPGLLVSSRGDAASLTANPPSSTVRQRLRVATYLVGSVQIAGDRIRVSVQMIDSATGFHIFSRSFDRERENFFEIRDEITKLTVANIRVALPADAVAASLQTAEEPEIDAYVLYRRGVETLRRPTTLDVVNEALAWFDRALEIDPKYGAAFAGRCEAYVRGFDTADDARMIERAETACTQALALNPNLVVVPTALGTLYIAVGRYEQAVTYFTNALAINPASADALLGLGDAYLALNRPDDAEESFRRALGVVPGDWEAYNRYGVFLFRQGRYAEAAEQYEAVAALDPDNVSAYSNLGAVYLLSGDFAASLTALERSIEIEPTKTAYTNLGMSHSFLGNVEKAIAAHRKAIDAQPNDRLAWANLGDMLAAAGKTGEAMEAYTRARELALTALEANSRDPYTIMDLAWISAGLHDDAKARELIDRALRLAPDDPYTHYYDALIHLSAGSRSDALDALALAADMGHSRPMLAADPHLAPLRSESRFRAIVKER
jgi:tetratricopeptide (TPR) repeat protein